MNETTKTKPILDKSKKDPDQANQFYNKLESVIKKVRSKDNMIIAGDLRSGKTIFKNSKFDYTAKEKWTAMDTDS